MEIVENAAKNYPDDQWKNMILNGLADAVLGFDITTRGTQLSQVDTLFKNNRWYLVSNFRQLLSEMYVEHGLIQTVVNVPVDDALRGGIIIKSKQLSPLQISELHAYMEREDVIAGAYSYAKKWTRLFGGGGILIIVADQDPMMPLDLASIGPDTDVEFRDCDLWELFWDMQNITEGYQADKNEYGFDYYSFYGTQVHKSRVIPMKGMKAPSFIRPRMRGWGVSVVEALVQSLNQYLKEKNLTFEVLDEFKLDIFKIKNLASTLVSQDGENKVRRRVQLANMEKSYRHAITMDAEDDYVQKQLTFAGLADVMREIRIQIACDLRMPLSKIFGLSASGFNSGEDDIENYNSMIESEIRSRGKYEILKLVEICCQKLFGVIPTDLTLEFKPLRVLSAEQEENVKTQKFSRVMQARQAGLISGKQFVDACNQDNLLPIQLDPGETLDAIDQHQEETASLLGEGKADAAREADGSGYEAGPDT